MQINLALSFLAQRNAVIDPPSASKLGAESGVSDVGGVGAAVACFAYGRISPPVKRKCRTEGVGWERLPSELVLVGILKEMVPA